MEPVFGLGRLAPVTGRAPGAHPAGLHAAYTLREAGQGRQAALPVTTSMPAVTGRGQATASDRVSDAHHALGQGR